MTPPSPLALAPRDALRTLDLGKTTVTEGPTVVTVGFPGGVGNILVAWLVFL